MARALRIAYPGACYHVTCRGNEQRAIFRDDHDRETFLSRLQGSVRNYQVHAQVYVLMDNHFHLVVATPQANLSAFMRHFNVSYTGYFNRRHKRVGHLYQGRFTAIVVEEEAYLLEVSRYASSVEQNRREGSTSISRALSSWSRSALGHITPCGKLIGRYGVRSLWGQIFTLDCC